MSDTQHDARPEGDPGQLDRRMDKILSLGFRRRSARTRSRVAVGPEDEPTVFGEFRVLRELGRGGMGRVFLAEDTRLHRNVAIKVLTEFAAHSRSLRARLLREAEAASKLDHPAICKVFEVGEADGFPFIAMQYVEGETLSRRIAAERAARLPQGKEAATSTSTGLTGRDEIRAALHLIERAARALHAAHEAGLVHRDVKPANIMVTRAGDPVLLDFGLARDADTVGSTLTRTGQLMGTPAYMPPEQLRGDRAQIDRRSDIYALGVTLYECLTHRRPFEAPTRDQLYSAILSSDPPDPRRLNPAISRDLKVVLETALEKDLNRRYQTAEDFAEDLRRVRELEPITARPVSALGQVTRWARRRPARAALVLVLAIGIPALAGLGGFVIAELPKIERQDRQEFLAEVEACLEEGFAELAHNASPARAIKAFEAALAKKSDSIEAIGGKALALLEADRGQECLEWLHGYPTLLERESALQQLRADALRKVGREEEASRVEECVPEPTSALGCFLAGARLMEDCEKQDDRAVFLRAAEWFQKAILLADQARPLYHFQLAHAAGHLDDETLCRTVADTLTRQWPLSAYAWYFTAFALDTFDRPRAIEACRKALSIKEDLRDAYLTLSVVLQAMGEADEALACYKKVLELAPDEPVSYIKLGAFYCSNEKHRNVKEAIRLLEKARNTWPENRGILFFLGGAYLSNREWSKASETYQRLVSVAPRFFPGHACLGRCLMVKGRYREAVAAFERALNLNPDAAPARYALAVAYEFLKEYGKAADQYGKIAEEVHVADLGTMLNAIESADDLPSALRLFGSAHPIPPERSSVLFRLGRACCYCSRWTLAIDAFTELLRFDRNNAKAHAFLGLALDASGKTDTAVTSYQRALCLDHRLHQVRLRLGAALTRQRRYVEAVDVYEQARKLIPGGFKAADFRSYGVALLRTGRPDAAQQEFRRALAQKPDFFEARLNLARALHDLGRFEDALTEGKKAAKLEPDTSEPYYQVGLTLSQLGRWQRAARAFGKAIRLGMRKPSVYCNLGLSLLNCGDFTRALDQYRKAHAGNLQRSSFRLPTLVWAEECGRIRAHESKLEPVLRSDGDPPSPQSARILAKIAFIRKHYGASAALYRNAFDRKPALADERDVFLDQAHRYAAARAAAHAGRGDGVDAANFDEADRARWRKQALVWLRQELVALEEQSVREATSDKESDRTVAKTLKAWTTGGFGVPCGPRALANLPEDERRQWAAFWGEVADLIQKVSR